MAIDVAAADAPLFPANDVELSYLAEGAANIIYRLSPAPAHASTSASASASANAIANANANTAADALLIATADTTDCLLRLRKALLSVQPSQRTYAYLATTAFPLFPAHLPIPTTLVRLPPALLARENVRLLALEAAGRRPARRAGLYLEPTEAFGFLVRDMTPHSARQLLVEFKPKWVVQSPSGPKRARRCRTCALRARRTASLGPALALPVRRLAPRPAPHSAPPAAAPATPTMAFVH